MLKTILTSAESFPYVKRRGKVVKVEKVGAYYDYKQMMLLFVDFQINLTPLEVAIIGMQDKIQSLRSTLEQNPPDGKLLQMQLQGGIATAVNQVSLEFDVTMYVKDTCMLRAGSFSHSTAVSQYTQI